jgi:hypothetical protein
MSDLTHNEIQMGDIRDRVIKLQISEASLNAAFNEHKIQNEKDFDRLDKNIESAKHDAAMAIKAIASDVAELKQFYWKVSGALLVAVPAVNHLLSRYF